MANVTDPYEFIDTSNGITVGFKIAILKSNNYVNASKMCKDIARITGSTKTYRQWRNSKVSSQIINDISVSENIPIKNLFVQFTHDARGTLIFKGTYVHPKLVPHIASYMSDTATTLFIKIDL